MIIIKTFKGRINLIYFYLVILIGIIGIVSVINLNALRKSIDGLMIDNYKSINAANNMLEILDKQDINVIYYIHANKANEIDNFYINSEEFYKWLNIEANNITEKGEKEYVEKIRNGYIQYIKLFSEIQDIAKNKGSNSAIEFYDEKTIQTFKQVKKDLRDLSILNEKVMLQSKERVTIYAFDSMVIIIIISIVFVIGSFVISKHYINKFFKPIDLLVDTMKIIKEGHLDKEVPVVFNDEIGNLAIEFNNMTKRLKKFEESTLGKLMEEKNRSISIVKSISDPLIVLDMNYKIMLLNSECEKFFNITEKEVIGKHFLEAIRDGELFDYVTNSVNSEEINQQIKMIRFNDRNYYFNIIVNLIKNKDLNVNGVIVFFQNVTELKQIENMKTEFVSSISHEFKTPLTSIMMGTSLIYDENVGELNDKQKEILKTISDASERLTELVNNLLRLARIEYDKEMFKLESCSIVDIINKCINEFKNELCNKNIKIEFKPDKKLPNIYADAEKISWVINNLISNSIKYMDIGNKITITAYSFHEKLYVCVKDNGVGIPDEYQNKIFNRFVQVKQSNIEKSGTGLGLAIAKEIIEFHNGDIWCESEIGEGCVFIFTLPISES